MTQAIRQLQQQQQRNATQPRESSDTQLVHNDTQLGNADTQLGSTQGARNSSDNDTAPADSAVTKVDILEYLAFSTYKEGDVRGALKLTNELLSLEPMHSQASGNKVHYERMLHEDYTTGSQPTEQAIVGEYTLGTTTTTLNDRQKREALNKKPDYKEMYERLCREEIPLSARRMSALDCRYTRGDGLSGRPHPYLLLQPVKAEAVYDRPPVWRYRDLLSDHDIHVIKELATPRLNRATIQNPNTGQLEVATYRISKSAWLKRADDRVLSTLWHRVEALTDMSMDFSEDLQVVNYGIGGHYEPHYDFARKEEAHAFEDDIGNRIATVLFYLSDVDAGGSTVFPDAGARVVPEKGSAVMWYNLFRSGEGDLRTRHAACPVLTGSKWVSNFWIHERGQAFRRPCALSEDE